MAFRDLAVVELDELSIVAFFGSNGEFLGEFELADGRDDIFIIVL